MGSIACLPQKTAWQANDRNQPQIAENMRYRGNGHLDIVMRGK
jgi:hypothetical protein